MPRLIRELDHQGWKQRSCAAEALAKMGSAATEAVPQLITALQDPDSNVRAHAAKALGSMDPAAAEAVPELIQALEDPDVDVRKCLADALGTLGPVAAGAVPQLMRQLDEHNLQVRKCAASALGRIGHVAAEAVPQLTLALKDRAWEVRRCSAEALGRMGPAAAEASPQLIRALDDEDRFVRSRAAEAFRKIHSAALSRDTMVAVLSRVDPCHEAHGRMLQLALSSHPEATSDPVIARSVLRAIWNSKNDKIVGSAVQALPEVLKVVPLSTFQIRGLVQQAYLMVPDVVVQGKLHELLGVGGSTQPAEQALSVAGPGPSDGIEMLSESGKDSSDNVGLLAN